MQYGPRIVWGRGCPSTLSGAHVIEFNETGSVATCCQCALDLEGAEKALAFMALPIEARRDLMAEGARHVAADGEYEELWGDDV